MRDSKLKLLLTAICGMTGACCIITGQVALFIIFLTVLISFLMVNKIIYLPILVIIYVFTYSLTTILWTEILNLNFKGIDAIVYNPVLAIICFLSLLYILRNWQFLKILKKNRGLWVYRLIKLQAIVMAYLLFRCALMRFVFGQAQIVEYYYIFLVPFLLFTAIVIATVKKAITVSHLKLLLNIFIFCALLNVVYGIFEYGAKENMILEKLTTVRSLEFNRAYFFLAHTLSYRISVLLHNPLNLALALLVAGTFTLSYSSPRRYILILIIAVGLIMTSSRIATVSLIAVVLISVFFVNYKRGEWKYPVVYRIAGLVILSLFLVAFIKIPSLSGNIMARFQADDGSAIRRLEGVKYFFTTVLVNPLSFLFGKGPNYSKFIASGIFNIEGMVSFEFGWLMMAIDYGLIVAIPFLYIFIKVVRKSFSISFKDNLSFVLAISSFFCFIQANTYVGLLTVSPVSLLLWFTFALTVANYISVTSVFHDK